VILLDTHALIWLAEGNDQLGARAKILANRALEKNELLVSTISFWEIAMLVQRNRIDLHDSIESWRFRLLEKGLHEIPINGEIAIISTQLKDFHLDPADRFITATALIFNAILITADEKILQWQNDLLKHNARK